ncbi:MAG: hypothetical protein EHM40_02490, partial [Chloroflexi bacterium]
MTSDVIAPFLIFLGLFFVYRKIVRVTLIPLLENLLNGPLRQLSISYFRDFAKQRFDAAAQQNNPDRAWEEIALEKVREIGHARVPYEKRRQNLLYIRNAPPNKRVAVGLIDVLPLQRDLNLKQEIACAICSLLKKIGDEKKENHIHSGFILNSLSAPVRAWNDIFSAWCAAATLLFFIWGNLDFDPPVVLGLLCALIVAVLVYPITRVNIKPASMLAYLVFSIFAVLAVLAAYASVEHHGHNRAEMDLSSAGYPGLTLSINYPKWAIYDGAQSCDRSNAINLLVEGGSLPGEVRFDYPEQLFSAKDSECHTFVPSATPENTTGKAFEFYLLPLDAKGGSERAIDITPILVAEDKRKIPLTDLQIQTEIEPA